MGAGRLTFGGTELVMVDIGKPMPMPTAHHPRPGDRVTFRVGGARRARKPTVRKVKDVTADGTVLVWYGGIDRFPVKPFEIVKVEPWKPRRG